MREVRAPHRRQETLGSRLLSAAQGARLVWLGLAGLGVLLLVGVGWWALRSEGSRSIEETVDEFFEAQRAGDCEGLLELVSEASWSNGGRWSRDEFLSHCAEALDGYEPDVGHVSVAVYDEDGGYIARDEDADEVGDRALVSVTSRSELWDIYRRGSQNPAGHVLREDGEWKVETDDVVLRIGRSVHETVIGYLDAYNQGDCERLIAFLSEDAWSEGGEQGRDEFLDGCGDAAESRGERDQPALEVYDPRAGGVEVRFEEQETADVDTEALLVRRNQQATAVVEYELEGVSIGGVMGRGDPERALLVKEGLLWKLDGSETLPDGVASEVQLAAIRYVELQALFLDEVRRDGQGCESPTNAVLAQPDPSDEIQFELGIRRSWIPCPDYETNVTLYQFAEENQARRAAAQMAGDDPARLTSQVTDVPGIPEDAFAAGTAAIAAHQNLVVRVDSPLWTGNLDDVARILVTQLEQL